MHKNISDADRLASHSPVVQPFEPRYQTKTEDN